MPVATQGRGKEAVWLAKGEATFLVLSGCFWSQNPGGKEWEATSSG